MKKYLSLVKFSHTIFAMPFALLGFMLAYINYGHERVGFLLLLVILCMVFARSAAMAFNRYLDREIDAKNERTAIREIPSGVITPSQALMFTVVCSIGFMITTYFINHLCFLLSPIALSVVLGYSYTKRFTALCHFVLGVGLGLAPVGSYLAISGVFDWEPILVGLAVLFWVAGFDIIYALQDEYFDRKEQLFSVPAVIGGKNALILSRFVHIISASLMIVAVILMVSTYPQISWISWIGIAVFVSALIYQQSLVKYNDLSRVNLAFFTTNGIASVLFSSVIIFDLLV
jgi:4-hydroxybenzoate polyprenyltransferase